MFVCRQGNLVHARKRAEEQELTEARERINRLERENERLKEDLTLQITDLQEITAGMLEERGE